MNSRIERFMKGAEALGYTCTGSVDSIQTGTVAGEQVGSAFLFCPGSGRGCIDKPNGFRKWYYGKTDAQFLAILKSVINAYK